MNTVKRDAHDKKLSFLHFLCSVSFFFLHVGAEHGRNSKICISYWYIESQEIPLCIIWYNLASDLYLMPHNFSCQLFCLPLPKCEQKNELTNDNTFFKRPRQYFSKVVIIIPIFSIDFLEPKFLGKITDPNKYRTHCCSGIYLTLKYDGMISVHS